MQDQHVEILNQFEAAFQQLPFLHAQNSLFKPLQHAFSATGKRLRPLCSLIVHQIFAPINADALNVAIALELFHNFTLIHDDVIDNSELRRGKPSVFQAYGLNASILSGDALLILAYGQIEKIHEDYKSQVLSLFNKTAMEVCQGQQQDLDLENEQEVSIAQYIEMVRLKTAVLIGCGFQMGAIITRQARQEQQFLYKIGEALGIAFQIQDDILDVYGDRNKTGKKHSADILHGKKTILLIEAIARANPEQRAILLDKNPYPDAQTRISTVMEIYAQLEVLAHAEAQLNHYEQICVRYLERMDPAHAREIQRIVSYIMRREF